MNKSATILTHPRFDRPKVDNPKTRGRKAGCISMSAARRRMAVAAAPNTQETPRISNMPRAYMRLLADGRMACALWEDDVYRAKDLLYASLLLQANLLKQMESRGVFANAEARERVSLPDQTLDIVGNAQ